MPFSCAASSASAIWHAIESASGIGSGPRAEAIGERGSFNELEDQRRHAIGFLQPVDRADVRMIERGEEAGFAREARPALGVSGEVGRQDLDRDVAPELAVARAIDLTHAASTERRDDRVRAELAVQHGRRGSESRRGRLEKRSCRAS